MRTKSVLLLNYDKACTVLSEQQTNDTICFISRLTSRNIMRWVREMTCAPCRHRGGFEPCSALIRIVDVMVNGKCS